ncbi:hypothetical protein, partial [Klebsiella pneumoniae]|uniref:hypothetical protein n=1 Tax=Klebsiella pneumoniae TaxID=573 RepID=UPI0038536A1C
VHSAWACLCAAFILPKTSTGNNQDCPTVSPSGVIYAETLSVSKVTCCAFVVTPTANRKKQKIIWYCIRFNYINLRLSAHINTLTLKM